MPLTQWPVANWTWLLFKQNKSSWSHCERDKNGSSVSSAIRARAVALIDVYYSCLIDALADAADTVILRTRANISKHWWSEELSNLKDKAYNSYLSWVDANRPRSGMIFDKYKSDKYIYKFNSFVYQLVFCFGLHCMLERCFIQTIWTWIWCETRGGGGLFPRSYLLCI